MGRKRECSASDSLLDTSQGQHVGYDVGIRAHLKLVSENIFLDYKNTKWNTKDFSIIQQTDDSRHMFKTPLKLSYHNHHEHQVLYSDNVSVIPSDPMCISLCVVLTDTD